MSIATDRVIKLVMVLLSNLQTSPSLLTVEFFFQLHRSYYNPLPHLLNFLHSNIDSYYVFLPCLPTQHGVVNFSFKN